MSRVTLAWLLLVAACAPSWRDGPHDRVFQRTAPPELHPKPPTEVAWEWWNAGYQGLVRPLSEMLNPGTYVERGLEPWLGGDEALDANAFGQVPDSLWFENRIGKRPLSPEEAARGPNRGHGPAAGALVILAAKTSGVTPGLILEDSAGDAWIVKFDPPWLPEMSTAAEIIGTKLMYAAGYHVPENYLVRFDLDRLRLSPKATTRDEYNRVRRFDQKKLKELVDHLNPEPDGRIRATFSKFLPGEPLGPFSFSGVSAHDPNDDIPHQRRRTLRGLEVLMAWINDTTIKGEDTLSVFVAAPGDDDRGFVRHYLIDFNGTLGSAENREKFAAEGFRHLVDWSELASRYFAVGMHYPEWLRVRRSPYRAVGIFEAEVFEPGNWRAVYGNPAFDEATPQDLYWAGTILVRFNRALVSAVVATGEYSEAGAGEYVTDVLMARRHKLLAYAFARVLPVDFPQVEGTVLRLEDLAATARLISGEQRYSWRVRWSRSWARDCIVQEGEGVAPAVNLAPAVDILRANPSALAEDPFLTVSFRREGSGAEAHVHLRVTDGGLVPVGLAHDVH